ncbi:hypothetical protein [Ramlibacter humi]|uniref:Uncharacterized protein n=1 Tax=Ramlibacter humi TaxID=2530451 RepID=A0A4Z0CAT3_9BURK|nr:hypothetical protein [Ramlibacter humi]TFZ08756.1 hypothetical protein EZ216_06315 [Ramlibacter humi]
MDWTEKIREWGAANADARERERAARQQPASQELESAARRSREQADRLHREVYAAIGQRGGRPAA